MVSCFVSNTPNITHAYVSLYDNKTLSYVFRFLEHILPAKQIINSNFFLQINLFEIQSTWWNDSNLLHVGKPRFSCCRTFVFSILGITHVSRNGRLTSPINCRRERCDYSRARRRMPLICLASQLRIISPSPSVWWVEEGPKRSSRNSDCDAPIVEVLNYPLYFIGIDSLYLPCRAGSKFGLTTTIYCFETSQSGQAMA